MKKKIRDLDDLEIQDICSKHPLEEGCKTCPLNIPNREHGCMKSFIPLSSFQQLVDYVNSKLDTEIECESNDTKQD